MRITPSSRDRPRPCDLGLMPEKVTDFRPPEKTFPSDHQNFLFQEDKVGQAKGPHGHRPQAAPTRAVHTPTELHHPGTKAARTTRTHEPTAPAARDHTSRHSNHAPTSTPAIATEGRFELART